VLYANLPYPGCRKPWLTNQKLEIGELNAVAQAAALVYSCRPNMALKPNALINAVYFLANQTLPG
jgi:hypothetical protein